MKVVINKKHGGFGLSNEGFEAYLSLKGITFYKWTGEFDEACYTTVPEAEYKAIFAEDLKRELGVGKFAATNAVFLSDYGIKRDDPALIAVVEKLGDAANSNYADLKVVEIPDDVEWHIGEYDGLEWVAENHRTWD